jgi:hypothetical protein
LTSQFMSSIDMPAFGNEDQIGNFTKIILNLYNTGVSTPVAATKSQ